MEFTAALLKSSGKIIVVHKLGLTCIDWGDEPIWSSNGQLSVGLERWDRKLERHLPRRPGWCRWRLWDCQCSSSVDLFHTAWSYVWWTLCHLSKDDPYLESGSCYLMSKIFLKWYFTSSHQLSLLRARGCGRQASGRGCLVLSHCTYWHWWCTFQVWGPSVCFELS